MKNDKHAIRYNGFESFACGDRQLHFSVDDPGQEPLMITFELTGAFFSGKNRLLLQEAAGICYSKLKDILNAECDPDIQSVIPVTAADISQYRQLPRSRAGHSSHRS